MFSCHSIHTIYFAKLNIERNLNRIINCHYSKEYEMFVLKANYMVYDLLSLTENTVRILKEWPFSGIQNFKFLEHDLPGHLETPVSDTFLCIPNWIYFTTLSILNSKPHTFPWTVYKAIFFKFYFFPGKICCYYFNLTPRLAVK